MSASVASLVQLLERLEQRRPIIEAQRAGAELYGAPSFSPIHLLDPGETTLSRVIGELLDPRGSHGQGLLFLNEFLGALELPRVDTLDWVRVRTEVPTPAGRRIDLVIETGALIVAIENKPWAGQSKDQLADYRSTLDKLATGKSTHLVFISQQEEKTAIGKVLRLPYYSNDGACFGSVLNKSLERIKAARVRDFVADLNSYLNAHFGEAIVVDETDAPYLEAAEEEALRDVGRAKAASILLLAGRRLHQVFLDQIGTYLAAALEPKGVLISSEETLSACLSERYGQWKLRRPSWPAYCAITIEPQASDYQRVLVGVRAPAPSLREQAGGEVCMERERLENLKAAVTGGNRTAWWPWYQVTSPSDWTIEAIARLVLEAPGALTEHRDIQRLRALMLELAEAVDQAVA
ncbi:MAG: hypothetical protein K0S56_255 [Microvirga sp.]|jgi:hypothetical protein|nr:hypothetical protein [Microvirga sp.]